MKAARGLITGKRVYDDLQNGDGSHTNCEIGNDMIKADYHVCIIGIRLLERI